MAHRVGAGCPPGRAARGRPRHAACRRAGASCDSTIDY